MNDNEVKDALYRQLRQELHEGETITGTEENCGAVWFTTSEGRTLSLTVYECKEEENI